MTYDDQAATANSPFDDEPVGAAALPAEKSTKPRLSILHLMVWTATSAAMMAVYRPFGAVRAKITALETAYEIGYCILGGIVVSGVLMWAARAWRRERFPVEPGEWLLVIQGGTVILLAMTSVLRISFLRISYDMQLLPLAFVVMGLLPAFLCRQGRVWRWFFSLVALLYCTPLIWLLPLGGTERAILTAAALFGMFVVVLVVILTLMLIGALASDVANETDRGWVHWVGVATAFLFVLYIVMRSNIGY